MTEQEIQPGVRVRLIGNSERVGTISQQPCQRTSDTGVLMIRVLFEGAHVPVWHRAANLEVFAKETDALAELKTGRIHGLASMQRILTNEKLSGRLANVIYSMETSQTAFLPYQFKPVLKLLESPTNSLLIADEVGLGKTIEAGLIWTELRARAGARNLLVICPPHLREKWQRELKHRFGEKPQICNATETLEHLQEFRQDPNHNFCIVASFHSLRPPANWENQPAHTNSRIGLAHMLSELSGDSPPIDLVVIDEAHYMRNRDNRTAELGELAAAAAAHRVFLSATPIHTRNENLYNLLRLLDPDTFSSEYAFQSILEANVPLVQIRDLLLTAGTTGVELREHFLNALQNPFLKDSRVLDGIFKQLENDPCLLAVPKMRSELAHRVERVNLLGHAINRTRKRDVPGDRVQREVVAVRIKATDDEKAFYDAVTELVLRYADQHDLPAGFLYVMPQRQVSSCMAAACARWKNRETTDDDDVEVSPDLATPSNDHDESHPLVEYISDHIRELGDPARLEAVDTKFTTLIHTLKDYWKNNPQEKVVLFSYFRPTLHYLQRRLAIEGIATEMLLGGMAKTKQEVVDAFRKSTNTRLLLSSEVGSEGLDIEFAKVLINYDLPWNPMVVEQRIGRLDRIGQKAEKILIINLLIENTIDERIYDRLYDRLNLFRRALGDLEAVLGPIVSELTRDLLTHRLTPEQQQERIKAAEIAIENGIQMQAELEENAPILAAYRDYILRQVEASHQMQRWIKAEEIERYVLDFFRTSFPKTRLQGVNAAERSYELNLDSDALYEFTRFLQLSKLTARTRLDTTQTGRLRFDNRSYVKPPTGEEVVSQSHPLVRFVAWKMRVDNLSACVPVAVRLARAGALSQIEPGAYVFNIQRWQVKGLREIERLHFSVARLDSGDLLQDENSVEQLIDHTIAGGHDWRDPGLDVDLAAAAAVILKLDDLASDQFIAFEQECMDENEDRARIQITSVDRFEKRRIEKLQEILQRHSDAGRSNLIEATRAQVAKVKERAALQRREIQERAKTEAEYHQICLGLISVE